MFLQDRITHVTCESTVELRIGAGVTAARTLGRPLKDARWRISAQPFLAAILTVFARVALFASLAGAAPAVASAASGAAIPAPAPTRASRTLIIIIPGTHGNENFWPVISPGNVTFGSELQRGAGAGSDVYPFLWSAPNEQTQRMQAARNLAAVIDDKAGRYDRICLVGHSYGGDVALCAAGMCKHKVDIVVCLSTPNLYLVGKTLAGDVQLPVYCTAAARNNIRRIITVCPNVDRVPDFWADVQKGITENDAIHLASGWLEVTGFPRLKEDGWMRDLGFADNLELTRKLNVADDNVEYVSQVKGALAPHYAVHSRRMGYEVGQLIHQGADDQSIKYLGTTLQTADADWGEPVPQAQYDQWLANHAAGFGCAGHLLRRIDLTIGGRDKTIDPYFKLCAADGQHVICATPKADTRIADFTPRWLLLTSQHERLDLWDSRTFGDQYIGNDVLNGAGPLPHVVRHVGGKNQWSWTARLDWKLLHY